MAAHTCTKPRGAHLALLLTLSLTATALAKEEPIKSTVQGNIFKPAEVKPTDELIAGLKVPDGFTVKKLAENLENPRMLAVAPNGDVYVTRRAPTNDVVLLKAGADAGALRTPETVAKIENVHGIAIREGKVYLAAVRELYVADILEGGKLSEPKKLYDDLPDAGQHPNRTIEFSPEGELFLSVGSTANAAPEPNKESATMLVVKTDGSGREIFAEGLRNTIGYDWHPKTGQLWGMDHGIDWLGDDVHLEELNLLQKGKKYGWPFVYEGGKPNLSDNPQPTQGVTWEEYAKMCEPNVMGYTAHAAPLDMIFYTGDAFPAEYKNDAFITMHGSWNREKPVGYSIVRLKYDDAGKPTEFVDFLTGFLVRDQKAQFGRPCGLAQMPDGSLIFSDDSQGVIYRITSETAQ